MTGELTDSLWIEKYRPKKLNDLVLPEQYKKDFQKMIEKCYLPNLLLSGPPGGGKTTLAKVLCSKNGVLFNKKDNLLYVNGSSRKSRGIGYVDDVIEPFLKHPPARDKYKVVFIDESDNLTSDSYDSLRAVIEKYHVAYGRFIFTCNYLSAIPGPVQSRFIPYVFSQIPKEYVLEYCKKVLDSENIPHKDSDVNLVIKNLYPDVRSIINALQRASWSGKLIVNEEEIITSEKKVVSYILEIINNIEKGQDSKIGSCVNAIIELASNLNLEYKNIYTDLFFGHSIIAHAKIIINKYSNGHNNCLVPHMHFMGMVFEIITSLQAYRRAISGK